MTMHCPDCGCVFTPKSRSTPQHARFFAMVSAAYHQWPEQYEDFQPLDSEHLRAWLLCRVGYRHVDEVDVDVRRLNRREMALMKRAYEAPVRVKKRKKVYRFWRVHKGRAYIVEPLSMDFENMTHEEACKVMSHVDDEVCSICGVNSTNDLLDNSPPAKETNQAA